MTKTVEHFSNPHRKFGITRKKIAKILANLFLCMSCVYARKARKSITLFCCFILNEKGQSSRCLNTMWMDFDMQNNSNSQRPSLVGENNINFFLFCYERMTDVLFEWKGVYCLITFFVQFRRFVVIVLEAFRRKNFLFKFTQHE